MSTEYFVHIRCECFQTLGKYILQKNDENIFLLKMFLFLMSQKENTVVKRIFEKLVISKSQSGTNNS